MTTHLPLMTRFCSATIPLGIVDDDGRELCFYVDGNSKITRENGTYAEPKPNAFSLPAASVTPGACPGSTEVCRSSCYVRGLAAHDPALYAHYAENLRVLDWLFRQPDVYADFAARVLARWIEEFAPGGFRWHVSGDVTGVDHAQWIALVCEYAPAVPFWIYTRTFEAVPWLLTSNLAVNVSADRENLEAARAVVHEYPAARLTYLCDDGIVPELPPGSVIFPDYALRGRNLPVPTDAPWWQSLTREQRKMVCSTDFFGQSSENRCGPCKKCF